MRFVFTDDQRLYAGAVRELLEKECAPADVRATWEDPAAGDGRWQALAGTGVLGMLIDEAQGGMGLSEVEAVLVTEEAGYAGLPEPLLEQIVASGVIAAAPGLADRWLGGLLDGSLVVGLRLTDPLASVPAGAEVVLVASAAAVHTVPASGVSVQPTVDPAVRLGSIAPSTQDPVEGVPVESAVLELAADRAAVLAAAQLLGLGRRCIELAAEYSRQREQFGRPIGSFQAVKHHLADALVALEFARPLVYRAAWSLADDDAEAPIHASMAKLAAARAAHRCTRAALQVHGAIGYTWEHDLHLFAKRVWALESLWGDEATHRARVRTMLLG